ncbi:MAG: alanine/glycine:cation symporter family protein [Anaeromusa sp.]|uniref:alanine/glycine:cation symporter family protein n=1 Tax=Anaeromusa sp. TaxID=1872520 RepID=UPI002B215C6E|nr:alanine/glycine:cation symporter family protein [Anaeromusa sp.]MEA4836178.1 alanine/glycine:cation symporter family protein [Anaeromusa sp.]
MENLGTIINVLNGYVWSTAMLVFVVVSGVYFSIRLRFTQVRNLRDMVRNLVSNQSSESGISTFSSFWTTMAARVGVGNIAGVAVAVYMGGPGTIFWMWVTSILLAAISFAECSLGQLYKLRVDGEYRGGAYYCAEIGLGWGWFSKLFAMVTVIGMLFGMPGIQANMIGEGLNHSLGIPPLLTGVVGAILLGIIILGGIKRISSFAAVLVPIKVGIFLLLTAIVLIANYDRIPTMFSWIFSSAFNQGSVFGGMMGSAIAMGIRRSTFASGAGMGEETPAAAAAETAHPAGQGLANSFGIYMDIIICTCSGLMILVTDCFNTASGYIGSGSSQMAALAASGKNGIVFPQEAVGTLMPGLGEFVMGVVVILFAFTTILSYYYQAETGMAYLLGKASESKRKNVYLVMKIMVLLVYIYFSTTTSSVAWGAADLACGMMVWLNVLMLWFLFPKVVAILNDYEEQRKADQVPFFDPDKVGISNVELWKEINKDKIAAAKASPKVAVAKK